MSDVKSKDYLRNLARQCMFECSEDELNEIQEEFILLEKQMELLNKVNTEGVKPLIYPFEMETSFMREDEVVNVLSVEAALSNTAKTKNGHVVVPKVVR